MNKKIIFLAGGTGGHIFPAINLMKHFKNKGYEVLLITDIRGKTFLENYPEIQSYVLKTDTPTNKKFLNKIFSIFTIFISVIKSILILRKEKGDIVFGMGGYTSIPAAIASKFLNLPLVIYENNMILGRANRFLSIFSKKIFLAKKIEKKFPLRHKKKTYIVGSILNKSIIENLASKQEVKEKSFSILVLGGSQGAEIFGNVVPLAIKNMKDAGFVVDIKQQCLKSQIKKIKDFYNNNGIKNYVFSFDENVLELMSLSNLAITRCGSSSIAELVHTLTPFIGVPLFNSVDNHQYLNVMYYQKLGCCWILEQDKFDSNNLFNLITKNINNEKLKNICKNMEKNRNKNVYDDIEKEVIELI